MDEDVETGFGSPIGGHEPRPASDTPNVAVVGSIPTPPAIGKNLTSAQIASLARQLAQNIRPPSDVLKDFGLTEDDYETKVKPNPLFAQALTGLIQEWNDAGNSPKRLRLQAQAILEDTMPAIGARISDRKEDLEGAVKAFQAVSKIAGMEEAKGAPISGGERFTITINLGGEQPLTYEKTTGLPTIEGKIADDKAV